MGNVVALFISAVWLFSLGHTNGGGMTLCVLIFFMWNAYCKWMEK